MLTVQRLKPHTSLELLPVIRRQGVLSTCVHGNAYGKEHLSPSGYNVWPLPLNPLTPPPVLTQLIPIWLHILPYVPSQAKLAVRHQILAEPAVLSIDRSLEQH